jgi:UDPglucose--hexose-1-phosphate uridylyltransferase
MPEIRVDPLNGLRTIIAPARAERPFAFVRPAEGLEERGEDPFAAGNESLTPPELYARRAVSADQTSWLVRVFDNLYPALEEDPSESERDAKPDLFTAAPARGAHEVIVNSRRSISSLGELDAGELAEAVETWRERMRVHAAAACLHLSVNEGYSAGASIPHTHAQLYALAFVPALIARERERFAAYATRTMGGNLLADLVQEEVRRRERVVAIDEEAVLLAPFASILPYQLMIAPRRPRLRFEEPGPAGTAMLHDALARLERVHGGGVPLNLWVRTAPRGAEQFCWRIDIVPRLSGLAGLELGTGLHLNSVAPEQAASELRDPPASRAGA